MPMCYTCVIVVPWGFPFLLGVLQVSLVLCHRVLCEVSVEMIVSVHILVRMIFSPVVPPSEVAQGPLMDLILGY